MSETGAISRLLQEHFLLEYPSMDSRSGNSNFRNGETLFTKFEAMHLEGSVDKHKVAMTEEMVKLKGQQYIYTLKEPLGLYDFPTSDIDAFLDYHTDVMAEQKGSMGYASVRDNFVEEMLVLKSRYDEEGIDQEVQDRGISILKIQEIRNRQISLSAASDTLRNMSPSFFKKAKSSINRQKRVLNHAQELLAS